jgi:hypothetical protein
LREINLNKQIPQLAVKTGTEQKGTQLRALLDIYVQFAELKSSPIVMMLSKGMATKAIRELTQLVIKAPSLERPLALE